MDSFSEVTAIVSMLANYVRTLATGLEVKGGSAQEKALQIVKEALEPKYTRLMKDFEKDPDTYRDQVARTLLKRTSQNEAIADQLSDLLYQFHKEESAFQKIIIVDQDISGNASGAVIGSDLSIVKGGDASQIGNR